MTRLIITQFNTMNNLEQWKGSITMSDIRIEVDGEDFKEKIPEEIIIVNEKTGEELVYKFEGVVLDQLPQSVDSFK